MINLLNILHKEIHIKVINNEASWFETMIVIIALIGPFATIPQVITIYSQKSAGSLSLSSWVMYIMIGCLWLCYGIKHKEKPIILTQILQLFIHLSVVTGIILYH